MLTIYGMCNAGIATMVTMYIHSILLFSGFCILDLLGSEPESTGQVYKDHICAWTINSTASILMACHRGVM